MPKATIVKVNVEASITFNEKELELLKHVLSYNLAAIYTKHTSQTYSQDVLEKFFTSFRQEVERVVSDAESQRKQLFQLGHLLK